MQVQSLPNQLNRKQRRTLASLERQGKIKMARSVEQIQQEYGQTCAANGERAFQIEVLKAEIENGTKRIVELGKEMQEAQAALKKSAEPTPQPSAPPAFAEQGEVASNEASN